MALRTLRFFSQNSFVKRSDHLILLAHGRSEARMGKKRNEDAFFLHPAYKAIGVADGVGGWSHKGIDASAFSQSLMQFSKQAIEAGETECGKILRHAVRHTKMLGSSTATLVMLRRPKLRWEWHTANLGDSSFVIIRDGQPLYQSPIQQHSKMCPYQFSVTEIDDLTSVRNTVSDAIFWNAPMRCGDVVVLGTDGLWDNVFLEDVVERSQPLVSLGKQSRMRALHEQRPLSEEETRGLLEEVNGLTNALTNLAIEKSHSTDSTPHEVMIREVVPTFAGGGKPDDVTVIVGIAMLT